MGRLGAFLTRLSTAAPAPAPLRAIACSEGNAVVIDALGKGTIKQSKPGACFFVDAAGATFASGNPFRATGLIVQRIQDDGATFDLPTWTAPGATPYTVGVDSSRNPMLDPANPYGPFAPDPPMPPAP
jgi:hypothetical protein